ncbi:ABC transporter ATP-binding protein/permease [Paraburkholderia sp. C35]|uniref:ABC transporter ATP-binding protein/permease n=1 Tax=Paraburkholderia sp. C35 TaxID=2126993 RepID=UPI000D691635|nr:ABC transporter ATP-binding protein/permease [Paraburkholderia sp. C35]
MNYRRSQKDGHKQTTKRKPAESDSPILPQGGTLRAAWRLVQPFWKSEQRWKAYGLLAFLLAEALASAGLQVWFNKWNGRFMDAIARYDEAVIWPLAGQFIGIVTAFVAMALAAMLASSTLTILWREWLTHRFIDRWLARDAFYRIEREQTVDNPDQRITVDIDALVTQTQTLFLGLIKTGASLVAFVAVLWTLSGPIDFSLLGTRWRVPGYLVWVALAYALVTSWIVHVAGRRLMPLTFQKERAEADFRFMMAGVREHAEQVALYHGSDTESTRMKSGFEAVRANFWQIVRFRLRFEPINVLITYISLVFAYFVALPRYLRHAISFGDLTQLSGAFMAVNSALSWFIHSYAALQHYRVVVARLAGLQQEAERGEASSSGKKCGPENILRTSVQQSMLDVQALSLYTPEGRLLAQPLTFKVVPGDRWLIRGKSGAGKSTLMRTLAGIWPYGTGIVNLPQHASLLFLPQKTYVPPGTLQNALCYPASADTFDIARCKQALEDCRLGQYVASLNESDRWGQRLSPGEQQRLAFARVLLHRPDYVFMDEATSAVDEGTERHLYETLIRQLPASSLISVSHHAALEQWHTQTLEILPACSSPDSSVPALVIDAQ